MNLKHSWRGDNGRTRMLSAGSARVTRLEADMLRLGAAQTVSFGAREREYGLLVLGGVARVDGDSFAFERVGERETVFDGGAYAAYIPRGRRFSITALTPFSAILCGAPADADHPAALLRPDEARVSLSGKPGWERRVCTVLDARTEACSLLMGEVYLAGGQWTSYPPHKHDTDQMPLEASSDEVYYFQFDKPQGFGIQRVYTPDGELDETYTVRSGDLIEIPAGYHPCCCAPGYNAYIFWAMAGSERGFHMRQDPQHAWLSAGT